MLPVFVRPRSAAAPITVLPTDLRAETGEPQIARRELGPFLPLSQALVSDPRLLDDLALALTLPCVARYSRFRRWLWLALIPLVILIELERELVSANVDGVLRRLLADLFFFGFAAVDLARPLPRTPRVVVIVLVAIALRYADMGARACGDHPALLPLGALSLVGAIAAFFVAPSRQLLRRQLMDRLAPNAVPPVPVRHDSATLGGALLVATGLPLALSLARAAHLGLAGQGAVLVVWAVAAPFIFERAMGRRPPRPRVERTWSLFAAVSSGVAATIALAHAWHYATGAIGHAWQCLSPAGYEHGLAKRFLDAQAVDAGQDKAGACARWVYIAMTVVVVPLAEERVFRDVLQRVLVARLGDRRGVAGAAALFGLAHLGVYGAATFDAVLLGVGFGVAYEGGGLIAAVLAHALWNLYWLA